MQDSPISIGLQTNVELTSPVGHKMQVLANQLDAGFEGQNLCLLTSTCFHMEETDSYYICAY